MDRDCTKKFIQIIIFSFLSNIFYYNFQVIGERFPSVPFEDALRDGIILCKLMNKLAPGIITKVNVSGGDYKMMDNISQ